MPDPNNPHAGQPILTAGSSLGDAMAAAIFIHGRGASAEDILTLAPVVASPDFACLAPQAAGHVWYPHSFLAPRPRNEPSLRSALRMIKDLIDQVETAGIPAERIALVGFSQGACLALEAAARHPKRYGAVGAFSGGLIGESVALQDYAGSLDGTPIFIGCSDVDPHIPLERVQESTRILVGLGAEVTEKIYPRMGHTINEDEAAHVRRLLETFVRAA